MEQRFTELVRSGTNFEFVGRSRMFLFISALVVLASLAMLPINKAVRGSMLNWTIDFKGGTEILFAFEKDPGAGVIRAALEKGGFADIDVSSYRLTEKDQPVPAYLVRLAEFGSVGAENSEAIAREFSSKFADRDVVNARWSGDTFFVRSRKALGEQELKEFLAGVGLEMKPWSAQEAKDFTTATVGINEFNAQARVHGLDRKVLQAMQGVVEGQVSIKQVDAVGAKAGAELIRDAGMSLFYAILFILLYIAVRFDFRYGPGTVLALLHDAIAVVGVYAVVWTPVSLTTLAALLTVIGYSMNDTIVVFDRIRENESKLKDKKFDRVINISVNETLSRTLLASLTTFVVTLALNILGTGLVSDFAFAMNVGIIVGTYSSIFVAAPVLLGLNNRYFSKIKAQTGPSRFTRRRRRQPEPAPN